MKRFALLLLLLAAPALAQDQTLEPDGNVSETSTDCTGAELTSRLSDNSDATECRGGNGGTSESWTAVMSFPTPTNSPSTTTDAQTFQCRAKKSSSGGNGDPSFSMNLFCGGSSVESGASNSTTDSHTSYTEFSETFTFNSGSCASDGSNVEVEINVSHQGGSPSGRRSVDISDCDWDVTWAAGGTARRVIVVGGG